MTLLAQLGWGKGDKITTGLQDKSIGGLIVSPRDENPHNAHLLISSLKRDHPNSIRLFDPLFHAGQIIQAKDRYLRKYGYYRPSLAHDDFTQTGQYAIDAKRTVEFQYQLDVTAIVSPTIELTRFGDRSERIALQLADASAAFHSGTTDRRPLILSFVINEEALSDRNSVDVFLDRVTLMQCAGIYLVVNRQGSKPMDANKLVSLMYITYVLGAVNGFSVYLGYTDLIGIPLCAAGAEATASGWFANLRRFTFDRFRPSTGGRHPRPRYLSSPALGSILVSELDQIYSSHQIAGFISSTRYDHDFRQSPPFSVHWPDRVSALHHWEALSSRMRALRGLTVTSALNKVMDWIDRAVVIRDRAEAKGVVFESRSAEHLHNWRIAIREFEKISGV